MKIYPANFDDFPKASPGEREIFARLKAVSSNNNWIVLHSLELLSHVSKSQSEADFVVMIPGKGILILEVKAARTVSLTSEGWQLGNKFEKRGPFKQANEAMRSIMEFLTEANIDISNTPFVYAVWFTHIRKDGIPDSISWSPEQVLSSSELNQDIERVLESTTDYLVKDLKKSFREPIASPVKLDNIAQVLLPRFTAHQSAVDRRKEIEEFLDEALVSQLDMVKLVVSLKSVLLQGLAGTGKTYIALQAAKLASERGEKVLFLCFNSILANFLKQKMSNFPLVKVSTLHALMLECAGQEVPQGASSVWWREELPEKALNAVQGFSDFGYFDSLIVDEAQDIGTPENLIFIDQLLVNGLNGAKSLICGDFDHQGVFISGEEALLSYRGLVPNLVVPERLLTNCRNTRALGEFLVEMMEINPEYDSYRRKDHDSLVLPVITKSDNEILASLKSLIFDFSQKYNLEQVVLLSSQKTLLGDLVSKVKFLTTDIRNPKPGHVRWGSVQEFKGMEALAVIYVEFEVENPVLREAFYIASTRSVHDFAFIMPGVKISKLVKENK